MSKLKSQLKAFLLIKSENIKKLESALGAAEHQADKLQLQLQSESDAYKNKIQDLRKKLTQKTEESDVNNVKHLLTLEQL